MTQAVSPTDKRNLWSVITASSVGTLIEWYDFFIFGSLATILSEQFFPKTNPTAAFLSTLATFAAGFVVRPFGALVFGRLGDKVGRKYTFLVTLVLMGGSTFAIGLVPNYETIGIFAPLIVLLLRLLQGLALGGEYGGAATYVAEHAPANRRGFYTSFIQITATLGLFVSLGVILLVRQSVGVEAFSSWGWRIPFILSSLLVGISIYIRLRMSESPLFAKIKAEGKISTNPIKESFGKKENLQLVLIALFGATAGQGVVWYTGQFYALSFLQKTCQLEYVQSNYIMAIALVIGTPLFIFFGAWSDKVGRKFIMLTGMLLAVFLYRPIYQQMYSLTNISLKAEVKEKESIERSMTVLEGDTIRTLKKIRIYSDQTTLAEITKETNSSNAETKKEVSLNGTNYWLMIGLIFIQIVLVTMVYGPIAAFLVELFPTRIRYTSMSLPYHIGNGIFGGLTPFIATALYELSKLKSNPSGDPFAGLWYPIIVAALCFVVGMIFLSNKKKAEVVD
ncbi:MAG: MHS family MFS transporter [Cytophagales bacterium]|nr:MHS family MFS transporter [Cytophagales bacterium]MCA6389044.1 MHS family MFS transporter [Cytophagales bacterium]MCA6392869.1 MHS family MFS transporter [Cytophagales bacterium]MCA6396743.1 MHS family MFS transporter [Cytophagales bacterium]MCA6400211.1 MHS family MFS transporter [Cytophagales bacterium]